MELNIYKNQKEVARVVKCDEYDVFYGLIEDVVILFDSVDDITNETQLLKFIRENKKVLDAIIKDVFYESNLTDEELRRVKVKELIPFFMDLIKYAKNSLSGDEKN